MAFFLTRVIGTLFFLGRPIGDSVTSIKTRSLAVKFLRPVFPGKEKVPSAIRICQVPISLDTFSSIIASSCRYLSLNL